MSQSLKLQTKNIIASIGHPRRAYESTTSMSHDSCEIENKWMSCTRRYVAMKQFLITSTEEKKVSSYAKSLFLKRIYLITEISYGYTYIRENQQLQSADSAFVPEWNTYFSSQYWFQNHQTFKYLLLPWIWKCLPFLDEFELCIPPFLELFQFD